jgi:hypothetical protein
MQSITRSMVAMCVALAASTTAAAEPNKPNKPEATAAFKVGDLVYGQWTDDQWYAGKIGAVNKDGTYRVDYDDGDVSRSLSAARVKVRQAAKDKKLTPGQEAFNKLGGGGLETVQKGPSQAGGRDCDKANAEQDAHFDANMNDPTRAVFGGAKLGCTYLEKIAWKAPTAKAAPAAVPQKDGPTAAQVVALATEWWATSDDSYHVSVLSGGVLGGWQDVYRSDEPAVASRRTLPVFDVIVASLANNTVGCFVVYGSLGETNLAHPSVTGDPRDARTPPKWSAAEYLASDNQRAQKVACPKGAKPPKLPAQ